MGVIDNGCPAAVMGNKWFRLYKDSLPEDEKHLKKEVSEEYF
jgi:hypothetical protein